MIYKEDYRDMLMAQAEEGAHEVTLTRYHLLVQKLMSIPFIVTLERDQNRVMDALDMRNRLCAGYGGVANLVVEPDQASVFEVMYTLAEKMSDSTRSFVADNSVAYWLIRIFDNLGLADLSDDVFEALDGFEVTDRAIDFAMERQYDALGNGGFYPLKNTARNRKRDMPNVELWYQMQYWLGENVDYKSMKYANFDQY